MLASRCRLMRHASLPQSPRGPSTRLGSAERWRRDRRLETTAQHRPDLIDAARLQGRLSPADEAVLAKAGKNCL